MKMYDISTWIATIGLDLTACRLMSDYEVTLVNDNSTSCVSYILGACSAEEDLTNFVSAVYAICTCCQRVTIDVYVLTLEQARVLRPLQRSRRESVAPSSVDMIQVLNMILSTIRWRTLEDPRRAARPISIQESKHRLREPDLPPKHR